MGLENIIGKWPGDETDEEIEEALRMMDACLDCEKLKARIHELEEGISNHQKNTHNHPFLVPATNQILWNLLPQDKGAP
jgi:hypothetical protein